MSYFHFLASPIKLEITSCVSEGEVELPYLTHNDLLEYAHAIALSNLRVLNQYVKKGRFIIRGYVDTQVGYQKTYAINEDWSLEACRATHSRWYYVLKPNNIQQLYHLKNGLQFIAKKFFNNAIDVDVWVRYEQMSKLFYIKELAEILDDPTQIKAITNYTELFSRKDVQEWMNHYGWKYPEMGYKHRLYLHRHVRAHLKMLKKYG